MFTELTKLYPSHACREHNYVWPLLVQNCGYRYVCSYAVVIKWWPGSLSVLKGRA